jgi:hypothetical protein
MIESSKSASSTKETTNQVKSLCHYFGSNNEDLYLKQCVLKHYTLFKFLFFCTVFV